MVNRVIHSIEKKLRVDFATIQPVGGGCINTTYRLQTTGNTVFFCKIHTGAPPRFFESETDGLNALRQVNAWQVPQVVTLVTEGEYSALVLSFIEKAPATWQYWENLGRALAQLHRISHKRFGWHNDNYIGSLPQINDWCSSWNDFFISARLQPLIKLAVDRKIVTVEETKIFDAFYRKINDIFPDEPPALLHGDLWSGNCMPASNHVPAIFDPAVYFGHREMDLAMTTLFGSFDNCFYHAYREVFPLLPGFEQRKDYYNLYPLLVHTVLFGKSYWYDIQRILK